MCAMSPQPGQGVNMALMDALALRDAVWAEAAIESAIARYKRERRAHVRIYQFWSRGLTPLFQSDRDTMARLRDVALLPLGRTDAARVRRIAARLARPLQFAVGISQPTCRHPQIRRRRPGSAAAAIVAIAAASSRSVRFEIVRKYFIWRNKQHMIHQVVGVAR